ncbi:MAG TPA: acyl-CoA dehydrogenase family protein [Candidatus Binatia bacterium]|jgi:acyl-CoA dehydrogenase
MDLRLSEEERLIRDTAARFVAQELKSREGSFLKQKEAFLPPGDPRRRDLDRDLKKSLVEKAQRAGLWALELPDEVGGSRASHVARVLIYREFGRTALPFEPAAVPAVIAGSAHAPQLASGETSLALAFHEVHRTGELSEINVSYKPASDSYEVDSDGIDVIDPRSDLYLVPAKKQGSGEAALFLIERGARGVEVDGETDLTTDQTVARLSLSGCKVPADHRLGSADAVRATVAAEQLRVAARALGMTMRCLDDSLEHARNRVTFGRPLAARQAIQWMLADLAVSLRTCTWLTFEAAWKADQGLGYFADAALAKKRAARMAFEAADTAIQIHGGYGVSKEFPFESFYREARLMRLLYGREAEIDRAMGDKALGVRREA